MVEFFLLVIFPFFEKKTNKKQRWSKIRLEEVPIKSLLEAVWLPPPTKPFSARFEKSASRGNSHSLQPAHQVESRSGSMNWLATNMSVAEAQASVLLGCA